MDTNHKEILSQLFSPDSLIKEKKASAVTLQGEAVIEEKVINQDTGALESVQTPISKEQKVVEVKTFTREKPTQYVSMTYGMNYNLGNYSMLKFEYQVGGPSGFEKDQEAVVKVQETFDFMKKLLEKKVNDELTNAIKLKSQLK